MIQVASVLHEFSRSKVGFRAANHNHCSDVNASFHGYKVFRPDVLGIIAEQTDQT